MARYMLLLHDNPKDYAAMPPEEMQTIVERYTAWSGGLAARGALTGGDKLKDDAGRTLRKKDGQVHVVDGPYAEAKEVVGGYFMVEAEGYDEAVDMCRDCPHLDYGGKIEIRAVDTLGNPG